MKARAFRALPMALCWNVHVDKGGETMEYFNAFWAGGLICALVQILLDRTKLMPGRVMVLLVTSGTRLGVLGEYGPLNEVVCCGASLPRLGFGSALFQGVKEAVLKDGFIGSFEGGLTASAAGISAALVFGYLASWIFE